MQHGIYLIKSLIKEKSNIFWPLLFPIFLGTLFYFMFGGLQEANMFTEVPIAIIATENSEFVEITKNIAMDNGKNMFSVTIYESMEKALKDLEDEKIVGIIEPDNQYTITVARSEIKGTLIESFVDQYMQNEQLLLSIMEEHPERLEAVMQAMSGETLHKIGLTNISLKGVDKDPFSQYFFALLAMTCLIGSSVGCSVGCDLQADCSVIGARRGVAPTTKVRQITIDFLALFILYDVVSIIVLLFCVMVLHRDFGSNLMPVMLATFVGNFCGIAGGMCISTFGKGNKKQKDGYCVAFFMVSSFFAGLQWADITFVLEKNCPIINRINPATLIVNSYKSLSVFGDYQKYWTNLGTLFLIGVLFLIASVMKLRRVKYASL